MNRPGAAGEGPREPRKADRREGWKEPFRRLFVAH